MISEARFFAITVSKNKLKEGKMKRKAVIQRVSDLLSGACGRQIHNDVCLTYMLSFKELQRWLMSMNSVFDPDCDGPLFSANNLDECDTVQRAAEVIMRHQKDLKRINRLKNEARADGYESVSEMIRDILL